MGLAYGQKTALGIKYIKIPYSNPEIKGWVVGKVIVKTRQAAPDVYQGQDFLVTIDNSLNKIYPEKEYLKTTPEDSLYLSCAKNETEGFQIVIIPVGKDLKEVRIELADLLNENKAVLSKENINLYQVGFVQTKKPFYNTPKVGLWPDPLIPLKKEITIKQGTIQPIWVNVYVPQDTPKGIYQGRLIIKSKGKKTKELKITLRVWDFLLSRRAHLKTAFDFYESLVDLRHPKRNNETGPAYTLRLDKLKKGYYLDMLAHRINPIHNVGNPKFLGKRDSGYILDFKDFDERVRFYKDFGQVCFGIAQEWPYGFKGDWTDKWYGFTDAQALEGVFRTYGKHLEEEGWLDNAYAYIFDETLWRVKEFTSLIHKGHPGIKNLVTMTPAEGYPDVDIWCVRINNLEKPSVQKFRKDRKTIWTYVASPTRPYPSLNLDLPSIEYRIIPWICWKYDIKGLLYWCVNWWRDTNPWQDPMTYPDQNGNGSLYYPDPQGCVPIGSIRLEVLRDGLEDYEYLYILKERLKELKSNPEGKGELIKKIEEILRVPSEIVKTPAYHTYEPDKIYKLREEIASLIQMSQ
jgi:hypothetical protein